MIFVNGLRSVRWVRLSRIWKVDPERIKISPYKRSELKILMILSKSRDTPFLRFIKSNVVAAKMLKSYSSLCKKNLAQRQNLQKFIY